MALRLWDINILGYIYIYTVFLGYRHIYINYNYDIIIIY